MKKFAISVLALCICAALHSQPLILQDPVSARTFNSTKYSQMEGTPFLIDKWTAGSVLTPRGIYKDLQLKLDAYDHTLYFNRDEKLFEFEDKITGFVLMPVPGDSSTYLRYRKGLQATGLRADQWVQILAEGKTGLYKLETKLITDVNQINQGVIKTFTTTTRYYIMKDGMLETIRINKNEVLGALNDKKDQVQAFISQNNISFKRDADVARVFHYYNSL